MEYLTIYMDELDSDLLKVLSRAERPPEDSGYNSLHEWCFASLSAWLYHKANAGTSARQTRVAKRALESHGTRMSLPSVPDCLYILSALSGLPYADVLEAFHADKRDATCWLRFFPADIRHMMVRGLPGVDWVTMVLAYPYTLMPELQRAIRRNEPISKVYSTVGALGPFHKAVYAHVHLNSRRPVALFPDSLGPTAPRRPEVLCVRFGRVEPGDNQGLRRMLEKISNIDLDGLEVAVMSLDPDFNGEGPESVVVREFIDKVRAYNMEARQGGLPIRVIAEHGLHVAHYLNAGQDPIADVETGYSVAAGHVVATASSVYVPQGNGTAVRVADTVREVVFYGVTPAETLHWDELATITAQSGVLHPEFSAVYTIHTESPLFSTEDWRDFVLALANRMCNAELSLRRVSSKCSMVVVRFTACPAGTRAHVECTEEVLRALGDGEDARATSSKVGRKRGRAPQRGTRGQQSVKLAWKKLKQ